MHENVEIKIVVRTWLDTYEGPWLALTADEAEQMQQMEESIGEILADPTGRFNVVMPGGGRRYFASRSIESVEVRSRPAGGGES